jgi:ABC-2 type transport system permease protein
MSALIRAELLKLRTTRVFWVYVVTTLAFVPFTVALSITSAAPHGPLGSSAGIRNVMSAASGGALMMLLVGIGMTAGEFRHNTATTTFLVTPDRRRVLAAKVAAAAVVGLGVGVLAALTTLAVALPWLDAKAVHVGLVNADVVVPVLGSLLATMLAAVVGVALGAVIQAQTLAITIVVIWTGLAEPLLLGLAPEVARWLPGGAVAAVAGTPTGHGGLLGFWPAAALLAGYAAVLVAAGAQRLTRTEIT